MTTAWRVAGLPAISLGFLLELPALAAPPPPCDLGPTFVDEWRGFDSRHPEFRRPTLIAVDPVGSVYLLDQELYLIRKFSSQGTYLETLELPDRDAASPMVAMAASDEFLYVSNGWVTFQFFRDGSVARWNRGAARNGLAVDRKGNLFLAASREGYYPLLPPDAGRRSDRPTGIWKLSSEGHVLNHWDAPSWPLAVAQNGVLYAVEPEKGDTLLRLDARRVTKVITKVRCRLALGRTIPFRGVAVSKSGHLFVNDRGNVVEADLEGRVLGRWCDLGPGRDPLQEPAGVAVDREGSLYVTDLFNRRVIKFDLQERRKHA